MTPADGDLTGRFRVQTIRLYGHDITYRMAGEGPAVVLVHGLAGSNSTWKSVMPALAERFTVVAPDLLGHGESAKPRGDYSLGAYASGVRDLLVALGVEHATVVGHSLGGGIAMQFAYQFPERVDRLVLVASGGLGTEVNLLLRAVALPGAEVVLPVLLMPRIREVGESAGGMLSRFGFRPGATLAEVWKSYRTLTTADGRRAFVDTVRSVIDFGGQRVSATDRLHLASALPTMIVWGERDLVIPVAHAHTAHAAIAGSRLELHPTAGHFLPIDHGPWLVERLLDFLDTTDPARLTPEEFRQRLEQEAS